MKPNYFKFYESCTPVIGANRGVIYDLTRQSLYFLPKQVLQEFITYSKFELDRFYLDFRDNVLTLKNYFDYLLENELIYFLDDPHRFPKITTSLIKPYSIDVLFLEIDNLDFLKNKIFDRNSINDLGCTNVVLISINNSYENLSLILDELEYSKVSNVNLIMKYEYDVSKKLERIRKSSCLIQKIIIFDSEIELNNESGIVHKNVSLLDLLNRKIENIDDFIYNQTAYLEALEKNLFFNRRIYIDNNHNIKHSFNDPIIYGNLKTDRIKDVIKSEDFKELWNVNKDKIQVCKDCEFRYICPDNRIPEKTENNDYFHKTTCNYNPYKNEWKQN